MQTRSQTRNQTSRSILDENERKFKVYEKYNLFILWLRGEFEEFKKLDKTFQKIEIAKKIYEKIDKKILQYSSVLDRKLLDAMYNKIPDLMSQIVSSAAKKHDNHEIYKLMLETILVLKSAEEKLKTLI
jgi:hypothetical protein